jgi:hypothetical protein
MGKFRLEIETTPDTVQVPTKRASKKGLWIALIGLAAAVIGLAASLIRMGMYVQ